MNESCHKWISHVTHMNASCHAYEGVIHIYECFLSHIRMSHVTHMNASCRTHEASCLTYEWGMSHVRIRRCTYMNESCHTYEWVISHIWMGHATHRNESCHTGGWVMSHMWMSHVTHTNLYCHCHITNALIFSLFHTNGTSKVKISLLFSTLFHTSNVHFFVFHSLSYILSSVFTCYSRPNALGFTFFHTNGMWNVHTFLSFFTLFYTVACSTY